MSVRLPYQSVRKKFSERKRKELIASYLMIAPVVLGLLCFFILPALWAFYLSFTSGPDYITHHFVGLQNYIELFTKVPELPYEVFNTFYYAFTACGLSIILSITLANALNKKMRLRNAYRVIYFLPSVTMASASGMVWRALLNSRFGVINRSLEVIGITGPSWLTDPNFMMLGVIIVGIWGSMGYNMIILLAGLQNIPRGYYEAAEIDGAGTLRQFFNITIPLLSPVIFFVLMTSLMGGLKVFDTIYTLSGGPGAPQRILLHYRTMVYGIYERGFLYSRLGLASAESVVLLGFILLLTLVQFKMQKKWVHYE